MVSEHLSDVNFFTEAGIRQTLFSKLFSSLKRDLHPMISIRNLSIYYFINNGFVCSYFFRNFTASVFFVSIEKQILLRTNKCKESNLHRWILIGMAVGFIVILLNIYQSAISTSLMENILWYTKLLGKDLFIGSLKMIIAPLIMAQLANGIWSTIKWTSWRYWL